MIYKFVFLSVSCTAYTTTLSCELSVPTEVLWSLFGGTCSLFACFTCNSRRKLFLGGVLSFAIYFISNRNLRAFVIGGLSAYLQTSNEIYASHLSLRKYRGDAIALSNFLSSMFSWISFFLLSFLPPFKALVLSKFVGIFCPLAHVLIVFLFLSDPPVEIIFAKKRGNPSTFLFGEIYQELGLLFSSVPFSIFHDEYTELVGRAEPRRAPPGVFDLAYAVLLKVNISFVFLGLLGILSTKSSGTMYLVAFAASNMFNWLVAQNFPSIHIEFCLLMTCVLLVFLLIFCYIDPSIIFIMAFGMYFVPSEEEYLALRPRIIALASSIKYLLASATFFVLQDYLIHK